MNLTLNELEPYLGGRLEIKNRRTDSLFQGEIKTLALAAGTLKISFVWLVKFEGAPRKPPRWVHVLEITEYTANPGSCDISGDVSKKIIRLDSAITGDVITFSLANGDNSFDNFNPLKIAGCPDSLESDLEKIKEDFLAHLNLNKIPKVNFGLEKIPMERSCRFLRFDLKWREAIRFFIRIQKSSEDDDTLIYHRFLDEIADRFSLRRNDIEKLVLYKGKGGGLLWLASDGEGGNKVEIHRFSSAYGAEKNRGLTVDLLKEALGCEVYSF